MADENIANYENLPLYKALKQYRYEKSKAENIKAYYVFKNDELIEIIKLMPTAPEQLKSIRGFGEGKIQKYGNEIVNIVNKYREITAPLYLHRGVYFVIDKLTLH